MDGKEENRESKIKTATASWQPEEASTPQDTFEVDSQKARKMSLASEWMHL